MWTNARHGVGLLYGLGDVIPVPQATISNATQAGTPREAGSTGANLSPITLVPPMPSITPPPPHEVTPDDAQGICALNRWVSQNPMLAVLGAAAVYAVLKGNR